MGDTAAVLRVVFERLNAKDADGSAALCSPRIELHDVPEIPGARTHRGPDEAREWAQDLFDVSDQVSWANWEMQERGESALIDTSVDIRGSSAGISAGAPGLYGACASGCSPTTPATASGRPPWPTSRARPEPNAGGASACLGPRCRCGFHRGPTAAPGPSLQIPVTSSIPPHGCLGRLRKPT